MYMLAVKRERFVVELDGSVGLYCGREERNFSDNVAVDILAFVCRYGVEYSSLCPYYESKICSEVFSRFIHVS